MIRGARSDRSETALEDLLAEPSEADIDCVAPLDGDVLILGAGGKMGPSLARRVHRAVGAPAVACRVIAVSRFSSPPCATGLEADGIRTVACDLLDPAQIAALPDSPNVLFLAGRKFGTLDRTDITWATNTIVPARVAEHFAQSRMVVFSTGNVYPLVAGRTARVPTKTIRRRRSASTRSRVSDASASSSTCRASTACVR